jgi:hypothetical protein
VFVIMSKTILVYIEISSSQKEYPDLHAWVQNLSIKGLD